MNLFVPLQLRRTFASNLNIVPVHIAEIEQETRSQATNPIWFAVRQHMITASKVHNVRTRMTALKRAPQCKEIDINNLIDKIAGRNSVKSLLPPLRYGHISSFIALLFQILLLIILQV